MKPFKIIISPDGTITSVYSDTMNLQRIGTNYINRATDVRFNNGDGWWSVIGIPPYFYKRIVLANKFKLRASAIEWEIKYLNKHLGEIIEAYSNGGYIPRKTKIFERKSCEIQKETV